MTDELITPENITLEQVHAILDAALFRVSRDDASGMLRIDGENKLFVMLVESKLYLRFLAVFGLPAEVGATTRITLANRVNDRLMGIRAAASGTQLERLCFDQYVGLSGGVSGKSIALAFKHFETLVAAAVEETRAGVVESSKAQAAIKQQVGSSFPETRATSDKAMLASSSPLRWR